MDGMSGIVLFTVISISILVGVCVWQYERRRKKQNGDVDMFMSYNEDRIRHTISELNKQNNSPQRLHPDDLAAIIKAVRESENSTDK